MAACSPKCLQATTKSSSTGSIGQSGCMYSPRPTRCNLPLLVHLAKVWRLTPISSYACDVSKIAKFFRDNSLSFLIHYIMHQSGHFFKIMSYLEHRYTEIARLLIEEDIISMHRTTTVMLH